MHRLKQLSLMTLLLCVIASSLSAQKWGVVTSEEHNYIPPQEFQNDGVIVLFDIGKVSAEYRGVEYERHVRLKVLDVSNLADNNKISISYYEYDSFKSLRAQIIKTDGTIIKLHKKEFTTIKNSSLRECQFEFVNLASGDIMEYSYQVNYYGGKQKLGAERYFLFNLNTHNAEYEDRGMINDDYFLNLSNVPTWYFDHKMFCRQSSYIVRVGAELDYSYVSVNLPAENNVPVMKRIKVLTATAYKQYTWSVEDIVPYESQDFQGSNYDEVNRVGLYFSLFSTGGQNRMIGGTFTDEHFIYMGRNFLGYLEQYLKKTKTMKKTAHKLRDKTKPDIENVTSIYNYITDEFKVDSSGFSLRPLNSNSKKFFKKKIGSPFELNLLFIQFLKFAGIDAYPVLVNTENKVSFRYTGNFNHVITLVKLEDEDLFIDASFKGCTVGTLPSFSKAKEGIVVDILGSYPIKIDAGVCVDGVLVQ